MHTSNDEKQPSEPLATATTSHPGGEEDKPPKLPGTDSEVFSGNEHRSEPPPVTSAASLQPTGATAAVPKPLLIVLYTPLIVAMAGGLREAREPEQLESLQARPEGWREEPQET